MGCIFGLDPKEDCRDTPCDSCTGNESPKEIYDVGAEQAVEGSQFDEKEVKKC